MMLDTSRMERLQRDRLPAGTEDGLAPYRNEVAPSAVIGERAAGDDLLVDPAYGLMYDEAFGDSTALYGSSEKIPAMPGDELANYGFLRVPFRRVPRRKVKSREELDAIVSAFDSRDRVINYWRGQAREYLLERNADTRWLLYGSPSVKEPSLLTSAGREGVDWEQILSLWAPVVCAHLDRRDELSGWRDQLYATYRLRALLLALAQHYSFPSAGLDLTPSLAVGLFFALHTFEVDGDRVVCRRKESGSGESVLYSLVAEPGIALDYDQLVPPLMTAARPKAQQARFLTPAWRRAPNACARMLFCAFYLDPEIDWGDDVPTCGEMFPADDPFAEWLDEALESLIYPEDREFLERHRPVVPG